MNSNANELDERLKCFATRVVKFARALPTDGPAQAIAKQLTKSGTSEAANYHAARRGRSRDEFISKLAVAAEEADETENRFRVIADSHIGSTKRALSELEWLSDESRQLRAILVASVRTARANRAKSKSVDPQTDSQIKSSNQILTSLDPQILRFADTRSPIVSMLMSAAGYLATAAASSA